MKQETCGKPEKGLPKQEKSREAAGWRKLTITLVQKAHICKYVRKPTLGEILGSPHYRIVSKSPQSSKY